MTPFFQLTSHKCSQCDVPPQDFNLRTLLSIQPLRQETMAENIDCCVWLWGVFTVKRRASTQFCRLTIL